MHTDQEDTLSKMAELQAQLKHHITRAVRDNDIVYVFGDLQDTPDNSKAFHYGTYRIPKHPLGIVRTCEDLNLQCTIYQHLPFMEKPIISRHGTKGGRFIDCMYATEHGLKHVKAISIIQETGILSDHDMVISKIDLGIECFKISKAKEERFSFRQIMNIPLTLNPGQEHPTLNDNVFKGSEYRSHKNLYLLLQKICHDPLTGVHQRITDIFEDLKSFEIDIINRTIMTISEEEQLAGQLVKRTPEDAHRLNEASSQFFNLLYRHRATHSRQRNASFYPICDDS